MRPLTSWKEIGSYIGRTARTAQRWERLLGLPIRRRDSSSSGIVCAFPNEIDAWLRHGLAPKLEACGSRNSLETFIDRLAAGASAVEVLTALALSAEKRRRPMVSFLLRDTTRNCLVTLAAPSLPPEYREIVQTLKVSATLGCSGPAIVLNRPVVSEDIQNDLNCTPLKSVAKRLEIGACVAIPIHSHEGMVLGSMAAYYPKPYRPTTKEIKRLKIVGDLASFLLQRLLPPDGNGRALGAAAVALGVAF
jgi:hypothetical protein